MQIDWFPLQIYKNFFLYLYVYAWCIYRMALLVSVVTMFLVMATWTLGLLSVYVVKSVEYVFGVSQVVLTLFLVGVHCANSQVSSPHTSHILHSL